MITIHACVLAGIVNNNNTDEGMLQQILLDQDGKHIDILTFSYRPNINLYFRIYCFYSFG